MQSNNDQNDLLTSLVREQGAGVFHLPYTPDFDEVCLQKLGHSPSDEERHAIWEEILSLRLRGVTTTPPFATQVEPISPFGSGAPAGKDAAPIAALPPPAGLAEFPAGLFDSMPAKAQQPWSAPSVPVLSVELDEERERLLADIADARLGSMEQRVAYLLHRFPETRDSDIALCIRYWRRFQADVLERWEPLELEVLYELDKQETIGRIRRHIQNKLRLFVGMEQTAEYRGMIQKEFHEYLAAHAGTLPEIRLYLDETGNEGDKAFVGVAGVCVMNWQQYEKHYAAIAQWRREQGWPETIHFAEAGAEKVDRAVRLLAELQQRRSGLLFVGYSLISRGRTHQDLVSLFIQLAIDSLRHLKRGACLDAPRSLRIIKEADPGFDAIYLEKMNKQLSELVAIEFPEHVVVQPIEPVIKGRDVFLECADLVAGGMQRRALYKGRNPKDKLAEAVLNVTGFEDAADQGAVFKLYGT